MSRLADLLKRTYGQVGEGASEPDAASDRSTTSPALEASVSEQVAIGVQSRIVVLNQPHSLGADRFRFLRMRLDEMWTAGKLKSLLITSPLPQDGKSTVAVNLATALAERGKRRVLVVEADLYHSDLRQQLGLGFHEGLAECLEGGRDPLTAVRRLDPLGWYLLGAGKAVGNPTDLLQADTLATAMRKLAESFDWVLIDSPPVIPLTDALSLNRVADGTLLVVRANRTPCEAIEKALALIGRERTVGVILNGLNGLNRVYSAYHGYYSKNGHGTGSARS